MGTSTNQKLHQISGQGGQRHVKELRGEAPSLLQGPGGLLGPPFDSSLGFLELFFR